VTPPSTEAIGQVVDQDPNPGTEAKKGSTVTLGVSQGPGNVRVPAVENLPERTAIKELNDAGLKANMDPRSSDTVAKGIAIRTVPREGVEVQRGGRVRLLVSDHRGERGWVQQLDEGVGHIHARPKRTGTKGLGRRRRDALHSVPVQLWVIPRPRKTSQRPGQLERAPPRP